MAAAAYRQGEQVAMLQALAALQTQHHERMAELQELLKQGQEQHKETRVQHQQRMDELGELQRHCQQHLMSWALTIPSFACLLGLWRALP